MIESLTRAVNRILWGFVPLLTDIWDYGQGSSILRGELPFSLVLNCLPAEFPVLVPAGFTHTSMLSLSQPPGLFFNPAITQKGSSRFQFHPLSLRGVGCGALATEH